MICKLKFKILIIIVILGLFACKHEMKPCNQTGVDNTIIYREVENNDPSILFVKDSLDYSIDFLRDLEKSGVKGVKLIDNMFIGNGQDTSYFPEYPELKSKILFTGRKENIVIALTVERINQTTIDYKIEMVEFGKSSYNTTGQATINTGFYIGSEIDENEYSGNTYASVQYIDSKDTCFNYIRIGRDDHFGNRMMAKIIKNCNNKIRPVGLDNFPTLIEKNRWK